MVDQRKTAQELNVLANVLTGDIMPIARGSAALATVTVDEAKDFFSGDRVANAALIDAVSTIQPDSPAIFRIGQSTATPSSGDEFGNLRSAFSFYNNSMDYYATDPTPGFGTQWVLTVGGFVPTGVAPTYIEQKGGIYVSVRSGRESAGTTPFSDTTGIQVNTNIIAGTVAGRAYAQHLNNTIDAGADGQAVGQEIEVNQIGGSVERDIFALNQKTALQLVPIGKELTKGIMFGVNTGGSYNQLMYVEQSSVRQAISTPVTLPSGRFDYGGSFFGVGDGGGTGGFIYRKCNINGYVVTANGLSQPRFSAQVVEHVLRPNGQILNIWETNFLGTTANFIKQEYVFGATFTKAQGVDGSTREWRVTNDQTFTDNDVLIGTHTDYVNLLGTTATAPFRFVGGDDSYARIASTSATGSAYVTFVETGDSAWSAGRDSTSGEFRITQGAEGLDSTKVITASTDRVGLFASPAVTGGSNHLYLSNGTDATAVADGASLTSVSGVLRTFQPGVGADSLLRFSGTSTVGAVTPTDYITIRLDSGALARIAIQLV